jgi:murein DD-endopeptidase MepM/ murein hydrolase activator NlpD
MHRRRISFLVAVAIAFLITPAAAHAAGWVWPVRGPVIRAYEPPSTPYGAGHRGIDIAAPMGSTVRAPAPGVVTFAGSVGGYLFVTVDHGGGLLSTDSWVSSILVQRGDAVLRGSPVALSGNGHPGEEPSHLHFAVKLDGDYVDPLRFLPSPSLVGLIRLAPIPES